MCFSTATLGKKVIKAVVDPNCPDKEPIIGTPSSCSSQDELDKIKAEKSLKKIKKNLNLKSQ